MAPANVQQVVYEVGTGDELRHRIQAVAAERSGRVLDFIPRDQTLGRHGLQVDGAFRPRDVNGLRHRAKRQGQRELGHGP